MMQLGEFLTPIRKATEFVRTKAGEFLQTRREAEEKYKREQAEREPARAFKKAMEFPIGEGLTPEEREYYARREVPVGRMALSEFLSKPAVPVGREVDITKAMTPRFKQYAMGEAMRLRARGEEVPYDIAMGELAQLESLGRLVVAGSMGMKPTHGRIGEVISPPAMAVTRVTPTVAPAVTKVAPAIKAITPTAIPTELEPLAEEVRKYASAEEFADDIYVKQGISPVIRKYALRENQYKDVDIVRFGTDAGKVGDFIFDPKLRTDFADVLDAKLVIKNRHIGRTNFAGAHDPTTNTIILHPNTVLKIGQGVGEISLRETLTHELIHFRRKKLGRPFQDVKLFEKTADKGAQFYDLNRPSQQQLTDFYKQAVAQPTPIAPIPAELRPLAEKIPTNLGENIEVKIKDIPVKSPVIQQQYEEIKDVWFGEKDWQAQKAKIESAILQKQILEITKERKYRELSQNLDKAIQIYIDLKRNPAHLEKYFNDLTPDQQKIVKLSQNLAAEQRALADHIAQQYKDIGLQAKKADVIRNTIDNYVARIWKIDKKIPTEQMRRFGITTRHAKARKLETIVEGWAKGYELQVEGATNNLAILKEEITNVVQDKKFIKKLQKLKDVEGSPLISTKQLEGYKRVEHPNFRLWKFTGQTTAEDLRGRNFLQTPEGTILERREVYAPAKIAKELNNIMGVSKLKGIKAIDVITKYNSIFKNWILQSNLFHHLAFMRSFYLGSAPTKATKVGEKFVDTLKDMTPRQAYRSGERAIMEMTPEIELLVRNGLTLGRIQDWEEGIIRRENTFIGDVLEKTKVTKAIKDKIELFRQQQTNFLFEHLGQGLKAKAALIELKQILKKHPEMDPNEAAKIAANLANDDFGGLHLRRMARNPTVQHIFRLFALAPDWTESNIRSMIKAFKKGTEGEVYRRFWARILVKGMLATLLINAVLNGEETIDSYKKAWKEGKLKWLDVDVTNIYKFFGGDTSARKYFSILEHFKDPLKFAVDPIKAAHYKGSVIYGTIFEAITGEDWAGRRFTAFEDLAKTGVTVEYAPWKPKPGKYSTLPSYVISQIKGTQPVQVQNLINWWAGEMEAFDAIANSLGLGVRTTYPKKKEVAPMELPELPKLPKLPELPKLPTF